jgi:hypothetical protein
MKPKRLSTLRTSSGRMVRYARYAAEFEFRYNNRAGNGVDDLDRAQIALRSIVGKRITYAAPIGK